MSPGPATDPGGFPDHDLTDVVLTTLRAAGLSEVGVAGAEPFEQTRHHLESRRDAGLHGGMGFTYRNPARSTDPSTTVDGARSLVVGAWDYLRAERDGPDADEPDPAGPGSDGPDPEGHRLGRVARYAWTDTYDELSGALRIGAKLLRRAGYRAVVVADQNALVDREAARRAGIGWYGHNANLLLTGRGSWFVLGSIVTDAYLTPSTPGGFGCGTCTRCLDGCPTGAIVEPGVVDANRCLSWLLQRAGVFPREWRVALGDRIYGCDDCQEVCPPNIARGRRERIPIAPAGAAPRFDVHRFLDDNDAAVVAAAGRWYVPQRDARYLRRNALLVLGNAARPDDPRAIAAIGHALDSDDPIVRGHAVWAASRLGRPDLADHLVATEADVMVRDELTHRAEVPVRR